MTPIRLSTLPAQPAVLALTATARGMVGHSMTGAAQAAFGELFDAVQRAGLAGTIGSCIGMCPDEPQADDDPQCRYVAGLVFGLALQSGQGRCEQPAVPLSGSLAWWPLAPGRHAVFLHRGPYDGLGATWATIYRDWLPASGEQLRDAAPFELNISDPSQTPPAELLTEIWLPIA